LAVVKKRMAWSDDQLLLRGLDRNQGPGNALLITLEYEHVTKVFAGFGEKGVSAETVANGVVKAARNYLSSEAAVSSFLADQLLLPMALAGGGSYIATDWSPHAVTNAEVIKRFLPVEIQTEKTTSGDVRVNVTPKC
jgi:RNA 3'-terminal phosphate cyclase (ATP)